MPRSRSLPLLLTLLLTITLLPVSVSAQTDPAGTPPPEPGPGEMPAFQAVTRVGTNDPVQTAVEASIIAFPGGFGEDGSADDVDEPPRGDGSTDDTTTDTVIIASVEDFADALTAAGLAGAYVAPLLYTNQAEVPQATLDEVERLGVSRVVLVGGPAAISDEAGQQFRDLGVNIVFRVFGQNRFATAAATARSLAAFKNPSDHAYLALGANPEPTRAWADAVAVSGLAAQTNRATLLTEPDALPSATARVIRELEYERITIVGGTAAVSQEVQAEVEALGVEVDRLAGPNRYATSAAVVDAMLEEGALVGEVWLASGGNFADALLAGPVAAQLGGTLHLTDSAGFSDQPVRGFLTGNRDDIRAVRITGGPDALGDNLLGTVTGLLDREVEIPDDAILVSPGDDLDSLLENQPANQTFAFTPGVHEGVEAVVRSGDAFLGFPGAILDGSREIPTDAFSQRDTYWVASGISSDLATGGEYGCTDWMENEEQFAECGSEAEIHRSEQLFYDNDRLRHVNSVADLEDEGTWYYDVEAEEVIMSDDPSGAEVRISDQANAFAGFETNNVTIEGLTIRRYGSAARTGAIDALQSTNWVIRNVEVSLSHGYGIRIGINTTIDQSRLLGNGQLGAGGTADESRFTLTNTELANNGELGFQRSYEIGGVKVTGASQVTMTNNHSHDNAAKGLWVDGECRDVTIADNLVERNGQTGILYELSFGGTVSGNTLIDNHTSNNTDDSYGNLQVVNSVDVEVFDNVMRGGDFQELTVIDTGIAPGVGNVLIRDNDVTLDTEWLEGTYGVKDLREDKVGVLDVTFQNNTLRVVNLPERAFVWDGEFLTLEQWVELFPTEIVIQE